MDGSSSDETSGLRVGLGWCDFRAVFVILLEAKTGIHINIVHTLQIIIHFRVHSAISQEKGFSLINVFLFILWVMKTDSLLCVQRSNAIELLRIFCWNCKLTYAWMGGESLYCRISVRLWFVGSGSPRTARASCTFTWTLRWYVQLVETYHFTSADLKWVFSILFF